MLLHDGAAAQQARVGFDLYEHYQLNTAPTDEFGSLPETPAAIRNVGWTLGNDCPYHCAHCYSLNARRKGMNMTTAMVDRVVEQLRINGIETVNLGGNEPLFTNGIDPRESLLPYIIDRLSEAGIAVGLTTSGISLIHLYRSHRASFDRLNDIDVSLDSPFEDEHNRNRGAKIYKGAITALEICQKEHKPHAIIMCGMNWNFTIPTLERLVELAAVYDADVRINPLKPILPEHMAVALTPELYYTGFSRLMELCEPTELGETPIAALAGYKEGRRCPCGRSSFRIHSITPTGELYLSPCVYLHDYKSPLDLLKHDLADIIASPQFRVFRQRNSNPDRVAGCAGCDLLRECGGGCTARAYLHHLHETGHKSMLAIDPYCPKNGPRGLAFPQCPQVKAEQRVVHMDYLCTWIGKPR